MSKIIGVRCTCQVKSKVFQRLLHTKLAKTSNKNHVSNNVETYFTRLMHFRYHRPAKYAVSAYFDREIIATHYRSRVSERN
jgi:hypothetical protein